ncbi:MAG: hypothetical protein WKF78_13320 [Candidatus Limnocylindrales bacterium]
MPRPPRPPARPPPPRLPPPAPAPRLPPLRPRRPLSLPLLRLTATATGPLKFANWPAYVDLAGDAGEAGEYSAGSSPTLEQFKAKYKIDVDYQEKIGDNSSFVETIKPALVGGLATGWDLIVLTDWMASKIIANGWAEKIDQANVPNCTANVRDALKGYSWDPTNDFHYPWQSGMTGIGVNTKALSENKIAEPTKLADLWTIPADKLTFLSEARDTFGLVLLKLGIDANADTVTVGAAPAGAR